MWEYFILFSSNARRRPHTHTVATLRVFPMKPTHNAKPRDKSFGVAIPTPYQEYAARQIRFRYCKMALPISCFGCHLVDCTFQTTDRSFTNVARDHDDDDIIQKTIHMNYIAPQYPPAIFA